MANIYGATLVCTTCKGENLIRFQAPITSARGLLQWAQSTACRMPCGHRRADIMSWLQPWWRDPKHHGKTRPGGKVDNVV